MSLMDCYDVFDDVSETKKYRAPTKNYFPSVAEINTYAYSNDIMMLPYLMWLDSELDADGIKEHKEAVKRLREIMAEMQ